MSKKKTLEERFRDNVKGSIAETLVKELFIANDYIVYDYGVEHLVPSFSPRIGLKEFDPQCETSKVIRTLPDFVVVKKGKAEYVEVKFTTNGYFTSFDDDYSFRRAFVVNVKKQGIFIARADTILKTKKGYRKIKNFNPFKLDLKTVEVAEKVSKQYFI